MGDVVDSLAIFSEAFFQHVAALQAGKECKQTDTLQQSMLLTSLNPKVGPQGQEDPFCASYISLIWAQAWILWKNRS